jgi:FlaA1/EpsC-like NDP-sugar epimerase
MPRILSRSLRVVVDGLVLSIAYWLAFLFRFEFALPRSQLALILSNWPYVVAVHYAFLHGFGVPLLAWRYITMRDAIRVSFAISSSTALLTFGRITLPMLTTSPLVVTPLGVLAMAGVLALVGLVGVRAIWRLRGELGDRRKRASGIHREAVLLIGAGEAGVMVAREIANRPDLGLKPIGFIDDDRQKLGINIGGLPVLGATKHLGEIVAERRVTRALITIANAHGGQIRRITELCRDAGLDTKIIPGIYEIVGGNVNLSRIREVAIEDLLGRAPVNLDEGVVGASIQSRVVLVTGAGGSIGAELCRQICRFGPARLILVERFENALFEIHRELASEFPHVPIDPRVADVCDEPRMTQLFEDGKPELVFHAAAHKHVPMMEWNPGEAVKNNVGGTRAMADLADRHGVERFVLISTDKAVNPSSVMGATKRVAEIYLQALSQRSSTRFVTVRFGNVLGSAGSVIPIFREQIARGGPITVTHPEMTRYFMTIPEASQLVLQAGAMGAGGEIYILDMGEPVRIIDLARDLITLSGLRSTDVEIKISGVRPGEKLHEELAVDHEHADKTKHPKVFVGRIQPHDLDQVAPGVASLLELARGSDAEKLRCALGELVPEYRAARPPRPVSLSTTGNHLRLSESGANAKLGDDALPDALRKSRDLHRPN